MQKAGPRPGWHKAAVKVLSCTYFGLHRKALLPCSLRGCLSNCDCHWGFNLLLFINQVPHHVAVSTGPLTGGKWNLWGHLGVLLCYSSVPFSQHVWSLVIILRLFLRKQWQEARHWLGLFLVLRYATNLCSIILSIVAPSWIFRVWWELLRVSEGNRDCARGRESLASWHPCFMWQ